MEDLKVRHQELLKEKRLTALSTVFIDYNKIFINHKTWENSTTECCAMKNSEDFMPRKQKRCLRFPATDLKIKVVWK